MTKLVLLLRMGLVAALLVLGIVTVAPVGAQDLDGAAAVQVDDEALADDDEGGDDFWDWGLLGLLGLLGLAGLFRQPKPVVHDTERPVTARRTADIDDDTRV